jgi:RNA polymerase primary sigma factor
LSYKSFRKGECIIVFDVTLKNYLEEIDSAPLLTAKEERQLGRLIIEQNDPLARDRLVRSNLRLVVNIAKRYANRGMSLSDLIEEGNLGLIRAVDYFNPVKGNRFSTYAAWWIKQSIKRAMLMNMQPLYVPTYMVALINQWRHSANELESRLGREPQLEEMADIMQLPVRKAKIINHIIKQFGTLKEMNVSEDDEQEQDFSDTIEDESAAKPECSLEEREEKAKAVGLLDKISPREAGILRLHYGLDGHRPLTLKQISEKLGLTRERIRQIQREALTKLYEFMNE